MAWAPAASAAHASATAARQPPGRVARGVTPGRSQRPRPRPGPRPPAQRRGVVLALARAPGPR
eukprot:6967197-Lingulodinium_polyedra.AAC.1